MPSRVCSWRNRRRRRSVLLAVLRRSLRSRRWRRREDSPGWLACLGSLFRTLVGTAVVARKVKPYWLCRCGHRNDRRVQKCRGEGCNRSKPKRRVPEHEKTLRDDTYTNVYLPFAATVHGVTDESCNICGRPRGVGRHHRDHGHNRDELSFGKPRGILCFKCNSLLPRGATEEWLHQAYLYLRRVRKFYELEAA